MRFFDKRYLYFVFTYLGWYTLGLILVRIFPRLSYQITDAYPFFNLVKPALVFILLPIAISLASYNIVFGPYKDLEGGRTRRLIVITVLMIILIDPLLLLILDNINPCFMD